jgi:hypothetical protein
MMSDRQADVLAPVLTPEKLHSRLANLNSRRFAPGFPDKTGWREELHTNLMDAIAEGDYLEQERSTIAGRAAMAPTEAGAFIAWFEDLKQTGPGQGDPLFPWLAAHATLGQMKWFLTQEIAGEAGFEDITALTQVRLSPRAKLELARNYWDEMGRGNPKGMHGPLLEKLGDALGLRPDPASTVWQSLALANIMAGLCANRRFAYHSVGALGAIEMTAPGRAADVSRGLKRLGVPAGDRHYFDLHATLDVKHSLSWNAEAIVPLVEENPACARAIAEGALMRLEAGRRCFERYRREFELEGVGRGELASVQ